MQTEVIHFPSDVSLAHAAAADWLKHLQDAFDKTTPKPFRYSVALSGGRITKIFFNELVSQVKAGSVEFKTRVLPGIHFFWADERCVPPTDLENNYLMANELLFKPLAIMPGQIHRIRGEAPEAEAIANATGELNMIGNAKDGKPQLDMIFLGMGEDGHTASLFPGEPDELVANTDAFRAVTAVKPPPRRITMGYSTIISARNVWVLASGKGKKESLEHSLSQPAGTPLGRILHQRDSSKVLTDIG